jgi:hypothetical protein
MECSGSNLQESDAESEKMKSIEKLAAEEKENQLRRKMNLMV